MPPFSLTQNNNRPSKLERRTFQILIIAFVMLLIESFATTVLADEISHPQRSTGEYAANFGIIYAAQWTVYLITQKDTIEKYGSFDHFASYPLHPEFDKDSFDYNIFKHALSGQYYYQFYRFRGYSEMEAFAWTFASSLAFEFAVETYSEKPSLQDIYQTPIYGTLVGMGFERASNYLLETDSLWAHALGYILNPFQLLKSKDDVAAFPNMLPIIEKEALGVNVSWRF